MGWQERAAARAQYVPTWLQWMALVPIGATAYWAVTYSGPYRWLAEWQLAHLDGHRAIMTSVVLGTVLLMPMAVVAQVVGGIRLARATRDASRPDVDQQRMLDQRAALQRTVIDWLPWIEERFYRLIAMALCAGLCVVGAYFAISASTAGKQVTIDVATLEHGVQPSGRHVALLGTSLLDHTVAVEEGRSRKAVVYIPIVSGDRAVARPAHAYLEIDESDIAKYDKDLVGTRHEGMVNVGLLPGVAQTGFTERGLPPPDEHWVIAYRANPGDQMDMGIACFGSGVMWGFITVLVWVYMERKKRAQAGATPSRQPTD